MVLVMDDGSRRKPDPVTKQVQSPAELDILVVRERAFVPGAGVDEYRTIDEHRAATGEQQRLFLQRDAVGRGAIVELKPFALEVHGALDKIDPLAGPIENAAGHG